MFFFFNDTATTEIYTLSLHDALPISRLAGADPVRGPQRVPQPARPRPGPQGRGLLGGQLRRVRRPGRGRRPRARLRAVLDRKSNTSELQSRQYLVCRLLLEKKKN